MKPSNLAPIYCGLYPQLSEIARKHGYAMAVHGSLGRDFDLICIPWIEKPCEPIDVVKEITDTFAIKTVGQPDMTFHGRERWTVSVSFGECFIDLSFMPRIPAGLFSPEQITRMMRSARENGMDLGDTTASDAVSVDSQKDKE